MKRVIVVAPHPDDETLGCGGTLLRHLSEGDEVHWLIMTTIDNNCDFTKSRQLSRKAEIQSVSREYPFTQTHQLDFRTMSLDTYSKGELISAVSNVFNAVQPNVVYLPYRLDAHSDHEVTFDVTMACCKSFRYPFIKTIRVYSTLSETEFGLRPEDPGFRPNCLINIETFMDRKLELMRLFEGEMSNAPFPRSEDTLRAEAILRGSMANCHYAEGFMTIKEII